MKFKDSSSENLELWFNDVFIFQQYSDIKSRNSCDVNNWLIEWVTLPIMSANMNAVSWKRMCETLSRYWWIWILPQDMSFSCKTKILSHIYNAHHEFDTPILVSKDDTVWTALDLIDKKSHWCVCLFDWISVIWYFKKEDLKQQYQRCMQEMKEAQLSNDATRANQLMMELVNIQKQLKKSWMEE